MRIWGEVDWKPPNFGITPIYVLDYHIVENHYNMIMLC